MTGAIYQNSLDHDSIGGAGSLNKADWVDFPKQKPELNLALKSILFHEIYNFYDKTGYL